MFRNPIRPSVAGRAAQQQHDVAERRRLDPVARQREEHTGRVAAEARVAKGGECPPRRIEAAAPFGAGARAPGRRPARRAARRPRRAPRMPRSPGPSASAPHGRSSPRAVRCRRARSARRGEATAPGLASRRARSARRPASAELRSSWRRTSTSSAPVRDEHPRRFRLDPQRGRPKRRRQMKPARETTPGHRQEPRWPRSWHSRVVNRAPLAGKVADVVYALSS